ncbi:hypothetical protein HAX54_012761, partial [Datura stramonium]|nr:hypothetical protein [Datura stramonium]
VANLIAKGQPQWATSRGLIHQRDLKFETRMWLDLVDVRLIPSQNTSKVPIEVVILLACIMYHANSVITLATKTDKDASVMTRAKYTGTKTPPPPSASTHTSVAPLHTNEFHSPTPPDLLNITQRAKMHESQLVRLAK